MRNVVHNLQMRNAINEKAHVSSFCFVFIFYLFVFCSVMFSLAFCHVAVNDFQWILIFQIQNFHSNYSSMKSIGYLLFKNKIVNSKAHNKR